MVKTFKSRYGDERILRKRKDGNYTLEGHTLFSRSGDGLFDFEGGPCIMVGARLLDIVNDVDDVIIESVTIDGTIVEENYMRVIITTKPIKRGKNKSDKKI
jgi:hypothetical protein